MMKKLLSITALVAFCIILSCSQTPRPAAGQRGGAVIEFETTEHDFGNIPQGGNGTYEFIFKNTGEAPLILANVRSSCGCTVPEWPKRPIKKGKEARIKVSYNTRIIGGFSKSISVYSNAGTTPIVLKIKGRVEEADL